MQRNYFVYVTPSTETSTLIRKHFHIDCFLKKENIIVKIILFSSSLSELFYQNQQKKFLGHQ